MIIQTTNENFFQPQIKSSNIYTYIIPDQEKLKKETNWTNHTICITIFIGTIIISIRKY